MAAGIRDVTLEEQPDVVLALHACDTATDDALLRAVDWEAELVLAAPVLPSRHFGTVAPEFPLLWAIPV